MRARSPVPAALVAAIVLSACAVQPGPDVVAVDDVGTTGAALTAPMCSACTTHADCGSGAYCLRNTRTGERFCGAPCTTDAQCGIGARCHSVGATLRQCAPTSGTCRRDAGVPIAPDAAMVSSDASALDAATSRDASTPDAGGCWGAIVVEELRLTNEARAASGLRPLVCDERLLAVALAHSRDMCERGYFAHTSPDGIDPFERLAAAGIVFRAAGENIAWGQPTPADVHAAWMGSSGHRANILGASFGRIGIGHHVCAGRPSWTQVFTD